MTRAVEAAIPGATLHKLAKEAKAAMNRVLTETDAANKELSGLWSRMSAVGQWYLIGRLDRLPAGDMERADGLALLGASAEVATIDGETAEWLARWNDADYAAKRISEYNNAVQYRREFVERAEKGAEQAAAMKAEAKACRDEFEAEVKDRPRWRWWAWG